MSMMFFTGLMPMDPLPDEAVLVKEESELKNEFVSFMKKAFELDQQGLVDYVLIRVFPLHGIVSFVCCDGMVKVIWNNIILFCVQNNEMVQNLGGNLGDGLEKRRE